VSSRLGSLAVRSSVMAALLFGALDARATTMVDFTDEDLSHIADAIVIATVEKAEPEVRFAPSGDRLAKQITTKTTLKVVDSWKGGHASGDLLTLREIGGLVEKDLVAVPGTAGFLQGERVLLFLHYRPNTNEYGLVGWTQGKYTLLSNAQGGWDVAKIRVDAQDWGKKFVAAEYENRAIRGGDLLTMAAKVKRVVAADAAANVNWRDMPKYKGLSGKGGGK
jgi:hypothetical protein